MIFKAKTKFNTMWIWVILLPIIGPIIYFSNVNNIERNSKKKV